MTQQLSFKMRSNQSTVEHHPWDLCEWDACAEINQFKIRLRYFPLFFQISDSVACATAAIVVVVAAAAAAAIAIQMNAEALLKPKHIAIKCLHSLVVTHVPYVNSFKCVKWFLLSWICLFALISYCSIPHCCILIATCNNALPIQWYVLFYNL